MGLRMAGRRTGILTDTGLALWPGGIRNRVRVRTRRTSTWTFGLGNLDFWTWMTGAPGLMAGELGPFSPCGLGRLGLLPRLAGPCQADSDCGLGLRRSHSAPVTVDLVDSWRRLDPADDSDGDSDGGFGLPKLSSPSQRTRSVNWADSDASLHHSAPEASPAPGRTTRTADSDSGPCAARAGPEVGHSKFKFQT